LSAVCRLDIERPAHPWLCLGILRDRAYSSAQAVQWASRRYLHRVAIVPPDIAGVTDWEPLAKGGFATVWRARQPSLNRPVAVKVDARTLDAESERRRFLGEAAAAGNLSGHPCIVTVYDTGILADGHPYLVMKFCSGGSLTSWLRPDNRQSVERICFVGLRIAEALVAAHEQGMLHRDVKPANILIDSYGNPGLADFGLTALEPGSTIGLTVAYAPPEVILGGQPSEFGDVYQLAATLYALLSGHPPSNSSGGVVSLEDRIARVMEPVKALPDVDEDLMRLLLDGLAFKPAERPTAAEFRDRLAALGVAPKRAGVRQIAVGLFAATVVSLVVALLVASGVYLYEIDRSVTANINRGLDLPPEETGGEKRPVKDPQADQTLDYLLIGTDDGDPTLDRGGRSDSLMLLHVNQARDEAYVLSIPRTTQVDIPGRGQHGINRAFEFGGPPLVVRTVEKLTGTRIDHVVMIDFQGFVKLTEDLGGVTVANSTAFSGGGHGFPAGNITVSGDAALWYVRERQANERLRAENQRNVVKAILAKGLSGDVVADPARFTTFLGNAAKRIQVDKTLTNAQIRSTAMSIRMKPEDITLVTSPLGEQRKGLYTVDQRGLEKLSQALRNDTMTEYAKAYPG
jgi:polyisoprenyl-teichoic acid--peptidoglycan teichoic acid transferase